MIVRPEEWLSEPNEYGYGLLKAWVVSGSEGFPIPIQTFDISLDEVALGKEQDFEIALECTRNPDVYPDEEAYLKEGKHSMAPEAVIPSGLLPLPADSNFTPSPYVIMSGKVTKTYEDPTQYGFDEGDLIYSFSCFGNIYDAYLYEYFVYNVSVHEGDIIHCMYCVHGRPAEKC